MPSAAEAKPRLLIGDSEFGLDLEIVRGRLAEHIQYLEDVIKEHSGYLADDDFSGEKEKRRSQQALHGAQKKRDYLQGRTPEVIFGLLQAIYNKVREYEKEGATRKEAANRMLDEYEEDFMGMSSFIDSGLGVTWSYNLAQVSLNTIIDRRESRKK